MAESERDPAVALFEALVAAPPESRRGMLDDARRSQPAVCAEVESLLRYHERRDSMLGTPCGTQVGSPLNLIGFESDECPTRIGEFEIIDRIGRGGMGDVYRARQAAPLREVALKVVRPELASTGMIARLQREAEALARLQHPGVAHVYHCGVGPDQSGRRRAFVVMELIKGWTLPEYLARHRPSIAQRLTLLAEVCDAVDHAHRRGVIHRDLKPGNILITDEPTPRPKVLDFGLASLRDVSEQAAAATMQGQVMGTLAYMSPEQADGKGADRQAVDTRSDVYSLGAVLFEMLTGRVPVDVAGLSIAQALAAIAHKQRPRAGEIDRGLRGDIEAIVAHALELDPAERYASAAEFAADIRRHLAGQPVLARPQTAVYQLRKLAARNKAASFALVGLLTAVLTGAGVATWQAIRIGHERDRAEANTRRARETAAFLRRVILTATPERGGGKETTLRAMLDEASDELLNNRGQPIGDPAVAIETLSTLAAGYLTLTENDRAETVARRAVELAVAAGGEQTEEGLHARIVLAAGLAALNEHDEAVKIAERAVQDAEAVLGEGHPIHIDALRAAAAAHMSSQINTGCQAALPFARRAYELAQKNFDPNEERAIQALHSLARVERAVYVQGAPEVDRLLYELLARRRATRGDENFRTLEAAQLLGRYLQQTDRPAECRAVLEPLLPAVRRLVPEGHNLLAHFELNLGEALAALNEPAGAADLLALATAAFSKKDGDANIQTVLCRTAFIPALIAAKRFDEAQAQIDIQTPIAAASGDVYFKEELEYQRLGLAIGRGRFDVAEGLAAALKGTHREKEAERDLDAARAGR